MNNVARLYFEAEEQGDGFLGGAETGNCFESQNLHHSLFLPFITFDSKRRDVFSPVFVKLPFSSVPNELLILTPSKSFMDQTNGDQTPKILSSSDFSLTVQSFFLILCSYVVLSFPLSFTHTYLLLRLPKHGYEMCGRAIRKNAA